MENPTINWQDFKKIDIRVGTILEAESLVNAINPAIKMHIDFGEIGILKTSAQLTTLYRSEELPGKQILAVVNLPSKQITNFMSECLVLGVVGAGDKVTLLVPEKPVKNGLRIA